MPCTKMVKSGWWWLVVESTADGNARCLVPGCKNPVIRSAQSSNVKSHLMSTQNHNGVAVTEHSAVVQQLFSSLTRCWSRYLHPMYSRLGAPAALTEHVLNIVQRVTTLFGPAGEPPAIQKLSMVPEADPARNPMHTMEAYQKFWSAELEEFPAFLRTIGAILAMHPTAAPVEGAFTVCKWADGIGPNASPSRWSPR